MLCGQTGLRLKFELSDYFYFKLLTAVPFFTALVAIYEYAGTLWWIAAYLGVIFWHINITYCIFCPHCPYYWQGKTCKCIMIWGVPKFYKNQFTPASLLIQSIIIFDILITTVFPIYWLWQDWKLMIIYSLSWMVLVCSLLKVECTRCIWFTCTKNLVPQDVREKFRKLNPDFETKGLNKSDLDAKG